MSICGRAAIRSETYLASSFYLNTIPPLEQDEMTVFLIQFRPYLSVNRGLVLMIAGYPEILRGDCSLSNIRCDSLKIVLDRSDG